MQPLDIANRISNLSYYRLSISPLIKYNINDFVTTSNNITEFQKLLLSRYKKLTSKI